MKKQARKPAGAVSGKFVTEMFSYEGGRPVTVYVPPDPPEAIIFAGDGQRISKWGRMLEKADVPSTMIVGAHGLTDEILRLQEYSSGFALSALRHTIGSSSRTFADGRSCGSVWRCPLNVPQCSASRRVESWPSRLGFGIHMSTARSSAPHPAAVISRRALCRERFRAHTLSPAHRSRSSSTTQGSGPTRCATPMRMSSCMSEPGRTVAHSGEKSSR
jgi:hypothetical protein